MFRALSLPDAQYIAHDLASELMAYDEPIPPFSTRYSGRLEACLMLPFQTFAGQQLYPRLIRKAAVLFYGVIKKHHFVNGNKRMAVALTLVFLYINGKWVQTSPDDLYQMARWVAQSQAQNRDKVIDILVTYFNKSLIAL